MNGKTSQTAYLSHAKVCFFLLPITICWTQQCLRMHNRYLKNRLSTHHFPREEHSQRSRETKGHTPMPPELPDYPNESLPCHSKPNHKTQSTWMLMQLCAWVAGHRYSAHEAEQTHLILESAHGPIAQRLADLPVDITNSYCMSRINHWRVCINQASTL
jgi:hypothetical protein